MVNGTLSAYGQVFMHGNPVTGAIVLLGILVNSRIMGVTGILGCLVTIGVSWYSSVPEARIADGELLFNSLLTVMALAGFFLYLDYRSIIYALFGGLLAQLVYIAASVVLKPMGLPAMVAGFALTTACFVLAAQVFGFVKVVPMEKLSKPENCILKNGEIPA